MLTLRLPEGLAKGSNRYGRFLKRVLHLKLKLESDGGVREELVFGPGEWDHLVIPPIRFPTGPKDSLTATAEVWDNNLEGAPRSYAVAAGRTTVEAAALNKKGVTAVLLTLSLRVGVREYDY